MRYLGIACCLVNTVIIGNESDELLLGQPDELQMDEWMLMDGEELKGVTAADTWILAYGSNVRAIYLFGNAILHQSRCQRDFWVLLVGTTRVLKACFALL